MPRHLSVLTLLAFTVLPLADARSSATARPNIVWIVVEDMSANFACYGETSIETPNVDALAQRGLKFTNAVVTAPVCSACRSALVTGMFQTSIGAHHHRSGRGELKIQLPQDVPFVPELFAENGYHVSNLSFEDFVKPESELEANSKVRLAKTDYNFECNLAVYQKSHWTRRPESAPFFCQIQLRGGKLRSKGTTNKWKNKARATLGSNTTHAAVRLPPYLPSHPVIVEDWAQYLDTVRYTDWEVGRIIARLRSAHELEKTVIFFITDHGISHVRNKQFCYEGGVHIPLIIAGPGITPKKRTDVVEHIDLAATSLRLANIELPTRMQGRDIVSADYTKRKYAFSARDRCDETLDRIRSVRSERFKYIRNQLPSRPYLQPNRYKDNKPIVSTMRELHAAGQLSEAQARIMAQSRPTEELYDLQNDPFELNNLALSVAYTDNLEELRGALDRWIKRTNDLGQQPEGAMYDSDMAIYSRKKSTPDQAETLRRNIALMQQWEREGK